MKNFTSRKEGRPNLLEEIWSSRERVVYRELEKRK